MFCALLVALLGSPAVPAAGAPPAEPKPGKKLCKISEQSLAEISGLVSTKDGYVAVADGSDEAGGILEVYDLNKDCEVAERHTFQQDPFDPEDMAIEKDGTLWIADTGDNDLERDTVALWKIAPDRSRAVIHRLTYPDGKHDAEALLMSPDGQPVIITKDLDGKGNSGVYVAKDPLKPEASVPLTKAGGWKLKDTGTGGNRFGVAGQKLVTGAAMSPDGKRAVVRTYADAYEWKITGGDIAKSLTKSDPVRTPLPGEVQGESITYTRDGKRFVTATEAVGGADAPQLYSYEPATVPPPKQPKKKPESGSNWFDDLSLQDIKIIVAVVGVIGLILLLVGVQGIRRHRRSLPPDYDGDPYGGPDDHNAPGGRGYRDRGGPPYPDPRDSRGRRGRDPRATDPRQYGGQAGGRAAGRAAVGPPPGVGRGGPPQGRSSASRDLPPRPGRGEAAGSSRVPPPSRSGRTPGPPAGGRVPPPGPARGSAAPPGRSRVDDPRYGQQPPSGEYW